MSSTSPQHEVERAYHLATDFYNRGEHEKAIAHFNEILNNFTGLGYQLESLYGVARSYQELNKCDQAITYFRKALSLLSENNFYPNQDLKSKLSQDLKTDTLIHLSYCYEDENMEALLVATILDALKKKAYLPFSLGEAELPARLAGAYARLGEFQSAQKYFSQAEKGLLQLKRSWSDKKYSHLLGKTLFYMGRMKIQEITKDNFDGSVFKLSQLQPYLYQAVELDDTNWSILAKENLIEGYKEFWNAIATVYESENPNDSYLSQKQQVKIQIEMCKKFLESTRKLRSYRVSREIISSSKVDELFQAISLLENHVHQFISEHAEDSWQTQSSKEREGLRREGNIIDKKRTLEKKSVLPSKGK